MTEAGAPGPEQVLEEGLRARLGRPVRVAGVERAPQEASSHPLDRLRVTLDTGEVLAVVFKRPRPGEKLYGNEREVLVYRRLLAGRRHGAPELYASLYDPDRGRYWLFLEDVGEQTLEQGDVGEWAAAARCLARMHAEHLGREDGLRALGCLGEHDAGYYRLIADTVRDYLRRAGASAALDRFDAGRQHLDALAEYLAGLPRSLVHGDIMPQNLILQPGPTVRPVDWESAAVGLPAWDLARLLDGWGKDKPRFVTAYWEEMERHAAVPVDRREFERAFACCDVLNVLWHLRWSEEACADAAYVDDRLNKLERLWRRLGREGTHA